MINIVSISYFKYLNLFIIYLLDFLNYFIALECKKIKLWQYILFNSGLVLLLT